MKPETTAVLTQTKDKLDSITQDLAADLVSLFNGDFGLAKNNTHNDVHRIEIEYFEDGYRLVAYPIGTDGEQLGSRPLLANYPDGILYGYDYDLDYELYSNDDNDEIDNFYRLQKDMFIQWFISCWESIGEPNLQKTAYFMAHDDNGRAYDLKSRRWV